MKILGPKVHAALDYVVVLVFLAAPFALGLSGIAAWLSWLLAGVHLALTLVTDSAFSAVKWVPLKVHGWIELAVGPALLASPWVLGYADAAPARDFYLAAGALIFATWLITDYGAL